MADLLVASARFDYAYHVQVGQSQFVQRGGGGGQLAFAAVNEDEYRQICWEITPSQLKERLDRGERVTIIDVREPHEWQIANLEAFGSWLIPLGQFANRVGELNPDDDIVVHCKMGGRSAKAY